MSEKKLSWGEVCKLMDEFEKFVEISPVYNRSNIYNIAKHFPLFLQQNGYEIWKKN